MFLPWKRGICFRMSKPAGFSRGSCVFFPESLFKENNRICGKDAMIRFTDDFPSDREFRRGRRAHYRVGENAMKKHFSLILILSAVALCALWTCGRTF